MRRVGICDVQAVSMMRSKQRGSHLICERFRGLNGAKARRRWECLLYFANVEDGFSVFLQQS